VFIINYKRLLYEYNLLNLILIYTTSLVENFVFCLLTISPANGVRFERNRPTISRHSNVLMMENWLNRQLLQNLQQFKPRIRDGSNGNRSFTINLDVGIEDIW
jgi:hypothetical protein